MRVLGIDPASRKCGYALVVDSEPVIVAFHKIDERLNQPARAVQWGRFVASLIALYEPDIVIVEECAPQRNAKTFRALVRFEAVTSYEVKLAKKPLILHSVGEARKIVVGAGNMKKEDVFYVIKDRYPDFKWAPIDRGGDDMADALVMALAGPTLAERR